MNSLERVSLGIYEKALPPMLRWPERLAAAAQAGFDFIEISIDESEHRLERLDWGKTRRAELREAICEAGVRITSMCLSGHRKYPMGSTSAKTRQMGLDIMRKAVDFAQDVGIRMILVPGYDVFYEPSQAETQARFLDGLWQGLTWASTAGVMLALENTERYVTSMTKAMWYVNELNSPWLQLYADVGNLVAAGYDVLAELEVGDGHIAGVHVKDTVPGTYRHIPFGSGAVPFTAVFRKLWELGFGGPVMLEMWGENRADAKTVIADARQWVEARIVESWAEHAVKAAGKEPRQVVPQDVMDQSGGPPPARS